MKNSVRKAGVASGGFTLVELTLALAVSGVILTAAATLLSAVAAGWDHSAKQFADENRVARVSGQLEAAVKPALAVLGILPHETATRKAVLLWRNDDIVADSKVQLGEIALIEHDNDTDVVRIFEADPSLAISNDLAYVNLTQGDYQSTDLADVFKGSAFTATPRVLVGDASVAAISSNFELFSPLGGKPMLNFDIAMRDALGVEERASGSVVLRSPQVPE